MLVIAVVGACMHRPPPARNHDELTVELVQWDMVRRRSEAKLLDIGLPAIALREAGIVTTNAVPRLAPHFAKVSVAWPTICERRGELSNDVFDYAMAWCRDEHDRRALERALVGFMSSSEPGLSSAALADLVDVVADAHDARTAIAILDGAKAPRSALDKLEALYVAMGREDDAAAVRTHLKKPPPDTSCRTLDIVLDTFEPRSIATLRTLAASSSACASIAHAVICKIQPACKAPIDEEAVRESHYLTAYSLWETDWFAVADHAIQAMPEPGAEQVAIAALSKSVRNTRCDADRLRGVRERAARILRQPTHDARWTANLEAFATITQDICEHFQRAS